MLFHMADTAILGIMAGDAEVAAVGACGSLISLIVCLVSGYSSAANVVISRHVGARDQQRSRAAAGTALALGFLSGVILMVVVLIFSRRFLLMTNCQPDILGMADLYMKIYFLGMPITMLYNFCASILRAVGDSVRPMIYMIISGVSNVGLNIVFVGAFHLTVSGVALATVLSNAIALVLILIALAKNEDYCKVERKNLRLRKAELLEMIRIGIPTCAAGLSFYFGEVVVTSAVNLISTDAMTANAISAQLDRINYTVGSSIAVAVGVMISQNFGAGNFGRIRKIMRVGSLYCISVTMGVGLAVVGLSDIFIGLFTDSDIIVNLTKERLFLLALTNFVTCAMEVFSNSVRALKCPKYLLIVGILCGFLIRSCWAWFVWPLCKTLPFLFICFPLSTFIGTVIYVFVYKSAIKNEENRVWRYDYA